MMVFYVIYRDFVRGAWGEFLLQLKNSYALVHEFIYKTFEVPLG